MISLIAFLALAAGLVQPQRIRIGEIELFGTAGVDVAKVRAALPIHEGDEIAADQTGSMLEGIGQSLENVLGHEPTGMSLVCCNERGGSMLYIGLGGSNSQSVPALPVPTGRACLA